MNNNNKSANPGNVFVAIDAVRRFVIAIVLDQKLYKSTYENPLIHLVFYRCLVGNEERFIYFYTGDWVVSDRLNSSFVPIR